MNDEKIDEAIIQLHNIARLIENKIGKGTLAQDVRQCADRLNTLLQPLETKESK